MTEHQKFSDEVQKASKQNLDNSTRSYQEVTKGVQAVTAEMTGYSKKTFEDATRTFEQLLGVKSFEQAVEIQSQYAKKAFEAHIAQMTKLGEMYTDMARNAFKPFEQTFSKKG